MLLGIAVCILLVLLYVLSLYLIPRHVQSLPRDDPIHVTYRMGAVIIATCLDFIICFILHKYVWSFPKRGNHSFMEVTGFRLDTAVESIFRTILLMAIFYLGPIITWISYIFTIRSFDMTRNGQLISRVKPLSLLTVVRTELASISTGYDGMILLRNFVIAPVTEELLFRALLTPALTASYMSLDPQITSYGLSILGLILGCPAFFSVAHLHHLYEKLRGGNTRFVNAIIQVTIQATYTYIFGCISMTLFIRTGNIFACIICHVICNFMGLPDVSFMRSGSSHYGQYTVLYSFRITLLLLHGLGLLLFSWAIFPVTASLSMPPIYA